MRNVVIAVLVGLVVGGLGTLWERHEQRVEVSRAASSGSPTAPTSPDDGDQVWAEDEPLLASRLGLVVHVSRDGEAVPDATVRLLRREPSRWVEQVGGSTDARGLLPLPAAPGRYLVAAVAAGRDGLALVDVAFGSRATAITVGLGAPRLARGRVLDSKTHAPLASALVSWQPTDDGVPAGPFAHRSRSDAFGRFSLEVPAGAVDGDVDAVDPRHQRASAPWTGGELELALEAAASVAGVVVDGQGAPVSGATVRAAPAEEQALTDDAGRFELKVGAGGTTVAAVARSGLQALQRVRLEPGERRGDLRLVVGRGAPLEGRVVDADGQGVAGAEVVVSAEPEQLELARVLTAANGAFTAHDLPEGRYTVAATTPQRAHGQVVGVEDRSNPVEVKVLARARLEGVVRLSSGVGAAGALVTVSWPPQLHQPEVTARADDDGHFVVDDLLAGEFVVRGRLSAIGEGAKRCYVAPGATGSEELTLVGFGQLHVVVKNAKREEVLLFGQQNPFSPVHLLTDERGETTVTLPAGFYGLVMPHVGKRFVREQVEVREGEQSEFVGEEVDDLDDHPFHDNQSAASGLSFDNGPGGVQVGFLMADSPAARAGLQTGDLVLSIGGSPVRDSLEAFAAVRRAPELRVSIRRDGADRELTIRPPE